MNRPYHFSSPAGWKCAVFTRTFEHWESKMAIYTRPADTDPRDQGKPLSEASRLLIVASVVAVAMLVGGVTVYFLVGGRSQREAAAPYYPVSEQPQRPAQPQARGARGGSQSPPPPASNDPVKNAIDSRLSRLVKRASLAFLTASFDTGGGGD